MDERVETGASSAPLRLKNDTVVNVALLLQQRVGEVRRIALALDWFALDDDLVAKDARAHARLTRISNGVLAHGHVTGIALVECVRCLELYEQPFEADFDQEYEPTIDVRSGALVEQAQPHEEIAQISDAHELDLAEPMRQVAILALPIKPICRDECPGLPEARDAVDEPADRRLGVLEQLLDDSRVEGE